MPKWLGAPLEEAGASALFLAFGPALWGRFADIAARRSLQESSDASSGHSNAILPGSARRDLESSGNVHTDPQLLFFDSRDRIISANDQREILRRGAHQDTRNERAIRRHVVPLNCKDEGAGVV